MKVIKHESWVLNHVQEKDDDFLQNNYELIRQIAKKNSLRVNRFLTKLVQGRIFLNLAEFGFKNGAFEINIHSGLAPYEFPDFEKHVVAFAKDLELKTKKKVTLHYR